MMYRRRSEVLKWMGCGVVVIGLVGWLIWQNQKAEDQGWLLPQSESHGTSTSWTLASQKGIVGNSSQGGGVERTSSGTEHRSEDQPAENRGISAETGSEAVQVVVHIAGAVQKSGVYSLPENARVVDAVKAAGGVTAHADLNGINLASPVADGDQVLIPYKDQADSSGYTIRGGVISSSSGSTAESVARGSQTSSSGRSSQSAVASTGLSASGRKVNINTASAEELMRLPGIGESKAAAIIRYREGHGRFQRPEDVVAVGGIGEKTFERLKDLISV